MKPTHDTRPCVIGAVGQDGLPLGATRTALCGHVIATKTIIDAISRQLHGPLTRPYASLDYSVVILLNLDCFFI